MRRLLEEAAEALSALGGVLVGREGAAGALDGSLSGVARSFAGALLGLPFAVYADGPLRAALGLRPAPPLYVIWSSTASQLIGLVVFPLLLGLLVRRLGGGAGFGRFLSGYYWLQFWLSVAVALLAFALTLGLPAAVQGAVGIAVAGMSLYLTWRLARELLTGEFALSLAVVLLSVAAELGSDYLVHEIAQLVGYTTSVR